MINWVKLVKATLGVIVIFILAAVVYNWYGDFKNAPVSAASNATQTLDPNGSQIATGSAGTTIGTVRVSGVNFRVRPASSAKLIRGLSKGEKVTVLAKEGQWYKVRDKRKKVGWITSSADYVAIQVK